MIAITSDLHCGSKHALCPPGLELADGEIYQLTKIQEWLWSCWMDFCKAVPRGSIGVVNGDITQGINTKEGALVSYKYSDQNLIAAETLKYFLERCTECYFIFGTEWHEFISGQNLISVVRDLQHDYKIHSPMQELWLRWQ